MINPSKIIDFHFSFAIFVKEMKSITSDAFQGGTGYSTVKLFHFPSLMVSSKMIDLVAP